MPPTAPDTDEATGPYAPPPAALAAPAAGTASRPQPGLSAEGSTRDPASFRAAAQLGVQAAEATVVPPGPPAARGHCRGGRRGPATLLDRTQQRFATMGGLGKPRAA